MLFYFSGPQAKYSAPSSLWRLLVGDRIVRSTSGPVRTVGAGPPDTDHNREDRDKDDSLEKTQQSKVFRNRTDTVS